MVEREPPEWGEVYDAVFSGETDVAFYVREAEQSGGPVLEIGCGSGRVLLPTAARGIDAWGIDTSRMMLDRLALRAQSRGLSVNALQADMRSFRLPQRFALITVPNRAFLHMATTEDQITALETFRSHLHPNGRLVLNFYHPSYDLIASPDHERREMGTYTLPDSGRVIRAFESVRRDRVNQLNHVTFHFEEVRPSPPAPPPTLGEGSLKTRAGQISPPPGLGEGSGVRAGLHFDIPFTHRWIYKREFSLLLRVAGFERWQVCGGFQNEPLERDDQEMVWTAWPGSGRRGG